MKNQIKAFPNPHLTNETGMELRDYFAAQALQGIVRTFTEIGDYLPENLSEDAYRIADAMMKERKL
jgi:hypothetical protein